MGKLHTLKRAVVRNPDRFIATIERINGERVRYTCSAYRKRNGEWSPSSYYHHSYKNFVFSTLKELGYTDVLNY